MKEMQATLEDILTIIEFKEDKAAFIKDFMNALVQLAAAEMLQTFPEEKRKQFAEAILKTTTSEEIQMLIKETFNLVEYKKCLTKITNTTFVDYITEITPTLPPKQQEALQNYLQSQVAT